MPRRAQHQRRRITAADKAAFIENLARGWSAANAARLSAFTRAAWYAARERDSEFAERWDGAFAEGTERLEAEGYRRAFEGVERRKPHYHRGERLDDEIVTEYSDRLLEFLLKGRRPERYGTNVKVDTRAEHDVNVRIENHDDPEHLAKVLDILISIGALGQIFPGLEDQARLAAARNLDEDE